MDFSLPADDNNSVFSVSPSSTTTYFTEQAMRAGFLGRGDFAMSSDPLRDAIQRELEKERIREEIIAGEILRRRELEMEVRRELAMEREFAMRRGEGFALPGKDLSPSLWPETRSPMLPRREGFSLEERATKTTTTTPVSARTEVRSFERLPFQRHCETAKGTGVGKGQAGQVMFLAKPTSSSVSGTKRKIAAVGAGELTVTGPEKKPHKDWSCALCQVSATSEQGLNAHLQGKKHKSKEGELRSKRAGDSTSLEKKTDKPNKLVKSSGSLNQKHGKKQDANVTHGKEKQKTQDVKKKKFKFWCEDCHVGCHGKAVMANHQRGKKHMARLEALNPNGGSVSSATTLNDVTQGKEDASGERSEGVVDNVNGEADENNGVEEKGEEEVNKELEPPVVMAAGEEATKELEDNLTGTGMLSQMWVG